MIALIFILTFLSIILLSCLVILFSWGLDFSPLSQWANYQEKYMKSKSTKSKKMSLNCYPNLRSQIVFLILLVELLLIFCLIGDFILLKINLFWVILIMLIGLIVAVLLSQLRFFQKLSQKIYFKVEKYLTIAVFKMPKLKLKMLELVPLQKPELTSKKELLYLLNHDHQVLSASEKNLIKASLMVADLNIGDIMISLEKFVSLKADDILGPLKINDLYQTKQPIFLVEQANVLLGVVYLADLTTIKGDKTFKVADLISHDFLTIETETNLLTAANKMVKEKSWQIIVTEKDRPVGIVLLKTILEHLKIIEI